MCQAAAEFHGCCSARGGEDSSRGSWVVDAAVVGWPPVAGTVVGEDGGLIVFHHSRSGITVDIDDGGYG